MSTEEFRNFLLRHGLNARDFADIIGVKFVTVDHWCHGRRTISLTVSRLCKLFDNRPELMQEFGK